MIKILSSYGKLLQKENKKIREDIELSKEKRKRSIKETLEELEDLDSEEIKKNLIN